jgi:hypothetical protein
VPIRVIDYQQIFKFVRTFLSKKKKEEIFLIIFSRTSFAKKPSKSGYLGRVRPGKMRQKKMIEGKIENV